MKTATKRKGTRRDRQATRWRRYLATRDSKIRNELVETYLPLVRGLAAKLASRLPPCVDIDDLRSNGVVGLVGAIEHFDPSRNVKFEIYAKKRITGAMLDELRRQDSLPRDARERADQVRAMTSRLRDELGREPSEGEVAECLGLDVADVRDVRRDLVFAAQQSLEPIVESGGHAPTGRGGRRNRLALLEPIDVFPEPSEAAHRLELLQLVHRSLDDRERSIVRGFYHDDHTMKHIGSTLRLSESRISQMHTEMLSRLRQRLYKEVAP
jgi:RNA polymerase sigma factor for flagellar operon FliA